MTIGHELDGADLPGVVDAQVKAYWQEPVWVLLGDDGLIGHCNELKLENCTFQAGKWGQRFVQGTAMVGAGTPQGGGSRPGGGFPQGDGFWVGDDPYSDTGFLLYRPNGEPEFGAPVGRSSYANLAADGRIYAEAVSADPDTLLPRVGYVREHMLEFWWCFHHIHRDEWKDWFVLYN